MSIDPAHAFAACRALRMLGGPTYLLHSRELNTIWVGAAAREDAAGRVSHDGAGFFSALRAGRKPAFFLFGSEAAPGGREPARALCVRPLVELRFDASGARAVFHGAPTSGLKAIVDAALAAPGTAPPACQPVSQQLMTGWETEPDDAFAAKLEHAIALVQGRPGKLLVTRGFRRAVDASLDALELAWLLAASEPDAPAFHWLELPGEVVSLGASPENVVESERGLLRLDAVAGTRPVHPDAEFDAALETELLASAKERREHAAALERALAFAYSVCLPGSVRVTFERRIRRLRYVRHLWSRVEGALSTCLDGVALLERAFPPFVSYPEDLAAQFELVLSPPRFYGGMVGRLDADGSVRGFLNLRSVEVQPGTILARGGIGVVDGSTRGGETREVFGKLRALHEAVENWLGRGI